MAGKKKKNESNKNDALGGKSKGKKKKKSKLDYENEIVDLNRKLAQLTLEMGPIEEELIEWENKYDEKEKELENIVEYLNAEEENEGREIDEYDKKIEVLNEETEKQRSHYEGIIADMEEEVKKLFAELDSEIYNTSMTLAMLSSQKDQMIEHQRLEEEMAIEEQEQERIMNEEIYTIEKANLRELDKLRKKFEGIMDKMAGIMENELEAHLKAQEEKCNDETLVCELSRLGEKYDKFLRELDVLKQEELEARLGLEIVQEQIAMKERKLRLYYPVLEYSVTEKCDDDGSSSEAIVFIDRGQQTDEIADENDEVYDFWKDIWETVTTLGKLAHEALNTDYVEEKSSIIYDNMSVSEDEIDPLDEQYEKREKILKSMAEFIDRKIELYYGEESEKNKAMKFVPCTGYKKEKLIIERKELERHQLWRNWTLPNMIKIRSIKREIPIPLI